MVKAKQAPNDEGSKGKGKATLRDTVKEALLNVLNDEGASAAAKASAGRTLLEYFEGQETSENNALDREMTAAELDAEIARLSKHK